ncbi:MAG: anhydro-N-acetylmuramic acid kinase [bacterium]|nr:anhydro-N-acetylmuramic acid kinase [bacterium]
MLTSLQKRKTLTVLGINSGTSIDSIDLAVTRISHKPGKTVFQFLKGFSRKFPNDLRQGLVDLADNDTVNLDRLIRTDNALGDCLGRAARSVQKKMASDSIKIDLIASHGQTIRHTPQPEILAGKKRHGTLQIGAPEAIAAQTLLPVAADFRQSDIALGNEGAPITVHAMNVIFGSSSEPRLIINIGGMSNYFFIPKIGSSTFPLASDCGPGNILSDLTLQSLEGSRFDHGGKAALAGHSSEIVLHELLASRFFSSQMRSTGREEFGRMMLKRILELKKRESLSTPDIMASVAELTVRAISRRVKPILRKERSIQKLYLTGGGRKNNFFVKRLRESLAEIEIAPVEELGLSGDYVEAAAYALMGEMTLRGKASPTLFDRKNQQRRFPILGSLFQPPQEKV